MFNNKVKLINNNNIKWIITPIELSSRTSNLVYNSLINIINKQSNISSFIKSINNNTNNYIINYNKALNIAQQNALYYASNNN